MDYLFFNIKANPISAVRHYCAVLVSQGESQVPRVTILLVKKCFLWDPPFYIHSCCYRNFAQLLMQLRSPARDPISYNDIPCCQVR